MLDILLVIIILIGLLRGYIKGFMVALTAFLSVGIALWVAIHFHLPFKDWLGNNLPLSAIKLTILSYILLFAFTTVVVKGLAKWLSSTIEGGVLGAFNRVLGALLLGSIYAGLWLFVLFVAEDGLLLLTKYYPEWEEQNAYVAYCLHTLI